MPRNAKESHSGSRKYQFSAGTFPGVDGSPELKSVTTILSAGLAAPALKTWGEKIVAEYAVQNVGEWSALDAADAVDLIKKAPHRVMTSAGSRGTDIHSVAELVLAGKTISPEWQELYGAQADAISDFVHAFRVRPINQEIQVANFAIGYAGSYDLLCEIDGTVTMIDWKSSKNVYGKTSLQLAAYSRAEFWVDDNGKGHRMPTVEAAGVVHLKESGYGFHPVVGDLDDVFEIFCHVVETARFGENERKYLGAAAEPTNVINADDLRERVAVIASWGDTAIVDLASMWPDAPTLKSDHVHTWQELSNIEFVIRRCEVRNRPSAPSFTVDAAVLAELRERLGNIRELNADAFAQIQECAVNSGVPNTAAADFTADHLAQLERIMSVIAAEPMIERRDAILNKVTAERTADPSQISDDEAQRFVWIATAI